MPLQISDRVRALGAQAQDALSEQFARIDAIAEYNTQKVLSAFQTHKVAESMFQGTTGYGYDDLGRETLGAIYADLFGAEDAMVRINFVNGTHAISSALYGVLRPGDVLVSAIGAPYDTLQGVIGITGDGNGSLKEFGITYRQVDLTPENTPDLPGIARQSRTPAVKAVLIQRSRGYATRASLSVARIGEICQVIRSHNPHVYLLVDNCYGEFVETTEPTQVGADLFMGSLIKNPGGGLGSYGRICGRAPGFGGMCRHADDSARDWPGMRCFVGEQPCALSRALPGPAHGGTGHQNCGVCRQGHGIAGLPY